MDSSIARQKIGKRRPAIAASRELDSKAVYRNLTKGRREVGRAEPYSPILQDQLKVPRRAGKVAKRAPKGARFPRFGARLTLLFLRFLALMRSHWRDASAQRLGRAFRSLKLKSSGFAWASHLSRSKQAIIALGALAAIIALSAAVIALARGPAFPLPSTGLLPQENSGQNLLLDFVSPELAGVRTDSDQDKSALPPVPVTLEFSMYTVRLGDTLASIAKRFSLYMDTIISANGISNASSVKTGIQLRIPNIDGLVYKVRSGDKLGLIARRYKIDTTRIVDANDIGSSLLVPGQSLFIPGARLPDSAIKQALGQRVSWPLRGPLSSFFGYRDDPFTGVRRFHAGIDIVTNLGTPVRSAMEGTVSDRGYNANYGNYVILNHADGFQTLYGHLTSASVAVGSRVAQGSVIGISGNTGYSTGPHLHFGLFRHSLPLNPLKYLK